MTADFINTIHMNGQPFTYFLCVKIVASHHSIIGMVSSKSSLLGAIRASLVAEEIPVFRATDAISDWSCSSCTLARNIWPCFTNFPVAKQETTKVYSPTYHFHTSFIKLQLSFCSLCTGHGHPGIKKGCFLFNFFFTTMFLLWNLMKPGSLLCTDINLSKCEIERWSVMHVQRSNANSINTGSFTIEQELRKWSIVCWKSTIVPVLITSCSAGTPKKLSMQFYVGWVLLMMHL